MVLPFFVLYLTGGPELGAELAGTMLAIYGVAALVAMPVAGKLCDVAGAQRVLTVSLFGSAAALVAYPLVRGAPALAVATAVLGMLAEAFRPASLTLIAELAPADRQKQAFALQRLAGNVGMSLGPALGGLLSTRWLEGIFYLDGLTSAIAAALLVWSPWALPPRRFAEVSGAVDARQPLRGPSATADRPFLWFLAALLLAGTVLFQTAGAMPLHIVRDLGLSKLTFGLLFTVNTVVLIVLEVPLTNAMAAWPAARSLALAAALLGLGFGAMALVTGASWVAATVIVWTLGEMVLFPCGAAFAAERSTPGRAGEYMGLYAMALGVAFAVGPWGGVLVLERFGGPALWAATLVVGLVAAAMFAALPTGRPSSRSP